MLFLSSKIILRILFLLLFVAIYLIKTPILFYYEIVFYLSFEILNNNKSYLSLTSHVVYNWLYVAFLTYIVLVRARLFGFSERVEFHLNSLEHLFFAGCICLMLLIYLKIFNLLTNLPRVQLALVFFTFNYIGILNEFFQNYFQHTPILMLKENDLKDIVVNLIGSTLFVLLSVFTKKV